MRPAAAKPQTTPYAIHHAGVSSVFPPVCLATARIINAQTCMKIARYIIHQMTGTILNIATVLIGGTIGLVFGAKVPERIRQTVVAGLGLFTAAIGVSLFMDAQNPIIVLISLLFGGLIGEWLNVELRLERLGAWLQKRFASKSKGGSKRFIRGFLTASLMFCIGPMTILGSISDGLTGDYQLLAIKSVLDGL